MGVRLFRFLCIFDLLGEKFVCGLAIDSGVIHAAKEGGLKTRLALFWRNRSDPARRWGDHGSLSDCRRSLLIEERYERFTDGELPERLF